MLNLKNSMLYLDAEFIENRPNMSFPEVRMLNTLLACYGKQKNAEEPVEVSAVEFNTFWELHPSQRPEVDISRLMGRTLDLKGKSIPFILNYEKGTEKAFSVIMNPELREHLIPKQGKTWICYDLVLTSALSSLQAVRFFEHCLVWDTQREYDIPLKKLRDALHVPEEQYPDVNIFTGRLYDMIRRINKTNHILFKIEPVKKLNGKWDGSLHLTVHNLNTVELGILPLPDVPEPVDANGVIVETDSGLPFFGLMPDDNDQIGRVELPEDMNAHDSLTICNNVAISPKLTLPESRLFSLMVGNLSGNSVSIDLYAKLWGLSRKEAIGELITAAQRFLSLQFLFGELGGVAWKETTILKAFGCSNTTMELSYEISEGVLPYLHGIYLSSAKSMAESLSE